MPCCTFLVDDDTRLEDTMLDSGPMRAVRGTVTKAGNATD
jgi:hypothetical protein